MKFDNIVVTDIYAAREKKNTYGISAKDIVEKKLIQWVELHITFQILTIL